MFWYFLGAIIGLIINIALSNAFAGFAEEKGYERGKYFLLCFFFGIIGYAWVGALPDANLQFKVSQLERNIRNSDSNSIVSQQHVGARNAAAYSYDANLPQNNKWTCKCGKKNPSYVTTCVCGTSKRDL